MELALSALAVVLGWYVAHRHSAKASVQLNEHAREVDQQNANLKREVEKLGRQLEEAGFMNNLMMRAMESSGSVEWSRDRDGRAIGITHHLKATVAAVSVAGHDANVITESQE